MDTGLLQKSISRVFQNKSAVLTVELFLLFLLGMIAVVVHSKLRIPMHLPGKQGLIFIALIVAGRGVSRFSFASSLICAGSATLLITNLFGFSDPFIAVNYILLGLVMDFLFNVTKSLNIYISAIIAGISWMTIPLFKLITSSMFLLPMNSFRSGIAYPFLTYLIFGIAGGLLGAGILNLIRKTDSK